MHENDSFAIFAFDTDFVVSLVHCIVLDADTYDCDKKTTLLYDPEVLCKYLRLEEDQLPLLAILAGNDFIDPKILEVSKKVVVNHMKSYTRFEKSVFHHVTDISF